MFDLKDTTGFMYKAAIDTFILLVKEIEENCKLKRKILPSKDFVYTLYKMYRFPTCRTLSVL